MALATLEDVERRLEEEPTERMRSMIEEALEDASDLARHYGDESWDEVTVPQKARRIVAAAVARWIRNPDGYTQSRAADETLAWGEADEPGAITFTRAEIEQLRKLAPVTVASFGSFGTTLYGPMRTREVEYVPWAQDNEPFPFVAVVHPNRRWRR